MIVLSLSYDSLDRSGTFIDTFHLLFIVIIVIYDDRGVMVKALMQSAFNEFAVDEVGTGAEAPDEQSDHIPGLPARSPQVYKAILIFDRLGIGGDRFDGSTEVESRWLGQLLSSLAAGGLGLLCRLWGCVKEAELPCVVGV